VGPRGTFQSGGGMTSSGVRCCRCRPPEMDGRGRRSRELVQPLPCLPPALERVGAAATAARREDVVPAGKGKG